MSQQNNKIRIDVTSPADNKIMLGIENTNQTFVGLKNDLIDILSKKGETLQLNSIMLTTEDGFEFLDEDKPMDYLENNDFIKIVKKAQPVVVVKKTLNLIDSVQEQL